MSLIVNFSLMGLVLYIVSKKNTKKRKLLQDQFDKKWMQRHQDYQQQSELIQSLQQSIKYLKSSIEEIVSSVNQISAMVKNNKSATGKTQDITVECKTFTEEGQAIVENMIVAIGEIKKSNIEIIQAMEHNNQEVLDIVTLINKINQKTQVINDIVFQTKLLSFNASVEAARAGEHGKGFSVVAEEVGNLAQMSGKASHEIATMLADSVKKVESIAKNTTLKVEGLIQRGKEKTELGSSIAINCQQKLNRIFKNMELITQMISTINSSTEEQSLGVDNIMKSLASIDQDHSAQVSSQTILPPESKPVTIKKSILNKSSVEESNILIMPKPATVIKKTDQKKIVQKTSLIDPVQINTSAVIHEPKVFKEKKIAKNVSTDLLVGELSVENVPSIDDARFEEV